MVLRSLSLCAGIGGIDLGLARWCSTVCYIEREAYCAALLVARMEEANLDIAPIWDDLKTFDGKPWRGRVDIITGGYPCQPFSLAGSRLGDQDLRHLWPDVRRIVGEVQPELCFFENVSGHLSLGFEEVVQDLEALDYRVAAGLFTAEEVGATHKRERLFILAHCNRRRREGVGGGWLLDGEATCGNDVDGPRGAGEPQHSGSEFSARSTNLEYPPGPTSGEWCDIPEEAQPAVRRVVDGADLWLDRLRALGNGVVPQTTTLAFQTLALALWR